MTPIARHRALSHIWDTAPGWGRLAAVNHTVLGRRFMALALVFFAIGGLLAMLIRAQLASGASPFMDAGTYAQVFTMHGTVMMFLFAIPFFEGLAIYLLPKMLGARDLAFPRLTAYGFWCYLFGGSILIVAMLAGVAPDSGWFMYAPLSSATYSPGINSDVWLLGITFVEISAMSAAIELTVSILKLRAGGMSLDRMPVFAWYMLVVAGMMLVGFPPLILGSILLEAERAFGLPFFDPTRGGDPLLWQHLFWLFGHPEVYIIFLPAAGALSTIIPVLARTRIVGYRAIVTAILAMGFLSFGLWVHHMYATGIPHLSLSFFSIASALVALPTAVQIFAWLATMAQGQPRFSIPMLHVFGFFFVFVCGGLSGVMLAMVPFDLQAHDTHFVVAHLHYVLVGGFVFPMTAAAYYWLPHLSGRLPVQHLSYAAFWTIFIGFNLTFLGMHLTGLLGMPRRVSEYSDPVWEWLNLISSVGGFVTTVGFALLALDLLLLGLFGRPFRRNPWRAGTLEWAMPTPPTSYAFAAIPVLDRRADGLDTDRIGARLAAGDGLLATPRNGWMETLAVDPRTGTPTEFIVLPGPTLLPLWSALATGGVFLSLLFKLYLLAPVFAGLTLWLMLRWHPKADAIPPQDAGIGLTLPHHTETPNATFLLAMRCAIIADATAFTSLIFGAGFLWVSAPGWPPPDWPEFGWWPLLPALGLLLGTRAAGQGIALLGFGVLIATTKGATEHASAAAILAVLCYAAVHVAIALVLVRSTRGRRAAHKRMAALWARYTIGVGLIACVFPPAMQYLAGG